MKEVKILSKKEVEVVKAGAGVTAMIKTPKDIIASDVFAIGNSLLK
jgi:hypothetical protein